MNLLGIDTSTAVSSVCVLRDDGRAFEHRPPAEALGSPPAHSRDLLAQVEAQLVASGLEIGDLNAVAIGVGPGGFTGLRIGIATGRAIASSLGIGVHPVSSLEALAVDGELTDSASAGVIDARRGEVYAEAWNRSGCILDAFVGSIDELVDRLRLDAGLGTRTVSAQGDGSLRFRSMLEAAGIAVSPEESPLHVVSARQICQLALERPAIPTESVEPTYLRRPDAVPLDQR